MVSPSTSGVGRIDIGDTTNAVWHRGSARTATVAAAAVNATTLVFTPALTAADIGRPISGTNIPGGTYIKTAAGAISRKITTAVPAATVITIEHTRSRVLFDAACVVANTTLTSPGGVFDATDVGQSVSGGPYGPNARVAAFLTATTVTVDANGTVAGNQVPSAACTDADTTIAGVQDVITIGAARYLPPTLLTTTYTDGYTRQITLGAGATFGGACAGSTVTLTAIGGGTTPSDVGLPATFKNATGATVGAVSKVLSRTATTIVLSAPCVAGATDVVIGARNADSPLNGDVMASLIGQLNLNPALVADQDDCNKNTYEGFGVIGRWNNPGAYVRTATLGAPLAVSTGQIFFGTAVVNFAGYINYGTTGLQTGLHNEFIFPSLPTGISTCKLPPDVGSTPGTTTAKSGVTLKFAPTTAFTAPGIPTGGGAPNSPGVRSMGAATGPFSVKVALKTAAGVNVAGSPITTAACTTVTALVVPANGCGDG